MSFELFQEQQYRSLEFDALEERRDAIASELENAESKFSYEELRSQSEMCLKEYELRNSATALRNAKIDKLKAGQGSVIERSKNMLAEEDITSSVEYRSAFKDFCSSGIKSEILTRGDESSKTTDTETVIPHVIVNQIIEKIEAKGMIIPLVTRTNYPSGQKYPTSAVKPVATWVAEGAGSDRQKKTTSHIVFTHHKLRCEISVSQEAHVMTLSAFEAKFIENVVEAMTMSIEQAIISGDGTTQPKGILKETPETGQAIELAKNTDIALKHLENAFAAVPQQYESGIKWFMTKKTFLEFQNLKASDGHYVGRIDHGGVHEAPTYSLLGIPVVLCGDYMANFTKAPTENTIFAFLFNPKNYVLNTNYDMGVSSKIDWDTEDHLWKAVMACDGKVIDKRSLVTLTIKSA